MIGSFRWYLKEFGLKTALHNLVFNWLYWQARVLLGAKTMSLRYRKPSLGFKDANGRIRT